MKKILFILFLLFIYGCEKPIDKIFIIGSVSMPWKTYEPTWYEADVLEKNGNMWKIRVEGQIKWFDVEDEVIAWRKR
jgi:hypothetical protein